MQATTQRVTRVLNLWHKIHVDFKLEVCTDEFENDEWDTLEEALANYGRQEMIDEIEKGIAELAEHGAMFVLRKDWGEIIVDAQAETGGADDCWGVWFTQEALDAGAITQEQYNERFIVRYYDNYAQYDILGDGHAAHIWRTLYNEVEKSAFA